MQDSSLSWLGTGTSVKSGRVKLVLWTQTSPPCEIMMSCKCELNDNLHILLDEQP